MAPYAEAYRSELMKRGYTIRTSVNPLRQAARLSRWAEANGFSVGELATDERIDEFVQCQRATVRRRPGWSRPGLACLLDVLREAGVSQPVSVASSASLTDLLLTSFERYLVSERGLAAGTVRGYLDHARRFLNGLPPGELAGVAAADVTASMVRKAAAGSVSAAQNFVAGLRAFLRFCFLEGLVGTDLSQATLSVTGRRRSSLPRGITKTDARALLDGCDRRTAIGRRD